VDPLGLANSRLRNGDMSMQVLPKHQDPAIPSGAQMLSTRLRRQPARGVHLGEGMGVGEPLKKPSNIGPKSKKIGRQDISVADRNETKL